MTNPQIVEFCDEETLRQQQHIYESNVLNEKTETNYKSLILTFISQLRPGMDITKIQAPTYILKPKSYLEMTSEYVYPTDALLGAHTDTDPEGRMLRIAAWVIGNCSMTAQKGFSRMKPYNPILGEKFTCTYEHKDSTTEFRAEQVSHHPPISASYLENRKHNIVYESTTNPKSTFWGNKVDMILEGKHVVHLLNHGEEYKIEFPSIVGRGIIMGSSIIEHNGLLIITCEKSGLRAEIDFLKKKFNEIEGYIIRGNEKLWKVAGPLEKIVKAVHVKTKKEMAFYDPALIRAVKKVVTPIAEQSPMESRRVWHTVTYALANNDFDEAGKYKHLVEEHQRKITKERKERGGEWKLEDFVPTGQTTKLGTMLYRYKHINLIPTEDNVEEAFEDNDLD